MIRPAMILVTMCAFGFASMALAAPGAGSKEGSPAQDSTPSTAKPPSRPLPLTANQISAVEQYVSHPRYAVGSTTRASYSPKAAQVVDDISARTVQFGIPAGILAVLIAAAPL